MPGRDKVCRKCKLFVKEERCPVCGGTEFSRTWKGLIFVSDPAGSEVAKMLGITVPGRYCLWVK